MKSKILALTAALGLFVIALPLVAQERGQQDGKPTERPAEERGKSDAREEPSAEQRAIAHQLPAYPLDTCVISGEKLGKDAVSVLHEGRLVRFCCNKCPDSFKKEPAASLKKIDAAIVRAQKPTYPLEKCPISGEALGDGAVDFVHGTKLVRFCCNKCVETFKKAPDETLGKLDAAWIASQRKAYPTDKCLVMEEEALVEGDLQEYLHGTRLVRLCCKKCLGRFKRDPAPFLAKLDERAKAKLDKQD